MYDRKSHRRRVFDYNNAKALNEKDALLRAEIKKDRAACFCAGEKVTVGVRAEDIMPLE